MITILDRLSDRFDTREASALVAEQVAGGVVGAVAANPMFGLPAVTVSTTGRDGAGLWLSEAVATFGLVLVIHSTHRSGAPGGPRVAGHITTAYWLTSSTNLAVTLARTLSDTFAGIAPASVAPSSWTDSSAAWPAGPPPRLHHTPIHESVHMPGRPSVPFVCVHNAGRSQKAQGRLRHLAGDRVDVHSAGSTPAAQLTEAGIDLTTKTPQVPHHRHRPDQRHHHHHGP